MAFYRKLPVTIEARQLPNDGYAMRDIAVWCGGRFVPGVDIHILIPTLEGEMRASIGDFVIKGIRDEFYPCKEDIFRNSYEEVS